MENKIDWIKAIIAGVMGTILFDIIGFIFSGQWWDVPGLLGDHEGREQQALPVGLVQRQVRVVLHTRGEAAGNQSF